MLAPDSPFAEREKINEAKSNKTTLIIQLDDNAEMLRVVFQVLHFRAKEVPARLTMQQMVELAIIADKYNLRDALTTWVEKWVTFFPQAEIVKLGNEDWLLVSHVFGLGSYSVLKRSLMRRASVNSAGEFIFLVNNTEKRLHSHLAESVVGRFHPGLRHFSTYLLTCFKPNSLDNE